MSLKRNYYNVINLCDSEEKDEEKEIEKNSSNEIITIEDDDSHIDSLEDIKVINTHEIIIDNLPKININNSKCTNYYISDTNNNNNNNSLLSSSTIDINYLDNEYLDNAFITEDMDEETRILMKSILNEDRIERIKLLENEKKSKVYIESLKKNRQNELDNQVFKCGICLSDDIRLIDMITLSCEPNSHRFCKECFTNYCESKINEAEISKDTLICPEFKCTTPITIFELRSNITDELFDKYERFTMRSYGEDNDCRFCPKCNVWFAEIPQEDDDKDIWKKIKCGISTCSHEFCGKCGAKPHVEEIDQNLTCVEYAQWMKVNSKVDEEFENFKSSNKFQTCFKCGNGGTLREGSCKFTICRCGSKYCFLCGVKLEDKSHYSHFMNGPGCTGPFGDVCRGVNDPGLKLAESQHYIPQPKILPPIIKNPPKFFKKKRKINIIK